MSGANIVPLRQDRRPKRRTPSDDRSGFLALENDICELAIAASLAVDLRISDDEDADAKVGFVLDQIERLAIDLREKYYATDKTPA